MSSLLTAQEALTLSEQNLANQMQFVMSVIVSACNITSTSVLIGSNSITDIVRNELVTLGYQVGQPDNTGNILISWNA